MEKPTGNQSPKSPNRKKATVDVEIISDVYPGKFDLKVHGNDLPPVEKVKHNGEEVPMLIFKNDHGGSWGDGYEVTFKLKDKTKSYGFFVGDPKNPDWDEAIWVECIASQHFCPRKAAKWPGFRPIDVSQDRQTLVVDNPNDQLQYFGFALRFSKDNETAASLTFDPIGDDRNGRI